MLSNLLIGSDNADAGRGGQATLTLRDARDAAPGSRSGPPRSTRTGIPVKELFALFGEEAGQEDGLRRWATRMMRRQISELDVPDVPELLEQNTQSGGHLWACRMSADMMKLLEEDLEEGVEGIISATDFMELTEGAQLLFI